MATSRQVGILMIRFFESFGGARDSENLTQTGRVCLQRDAIFRFQRRWNNLDRIIAVNLLYFKLEAC